ncbi:unnamed protein product [Phaedon cochleariae]|uniref:Fatty acid desaturase domain-containing protein n=1 Tax=Phaedon cochleariae TaxID=80249 RepID=A0A9P0DID6_PHACE|nr:unnamed protein product [Phaedon cochleariae]
MTVNVNSERFAKESVEFNKNKATDIGTDYNFKRAIVWPNAIGFLVLHALGFYGIYLCFKCNLLTVAWTFFMAFASGEGITIGAHRLYSHKSFKATFTLRLILNILQTVAGQNCMYIWVRDHRQHHKYSDTDGDPHNASRGFFFSHMGWLMSKKHPMVIKKGKCIDMSDLEADSIVMFQKKYYKLLYMVFAIAIPVAVPIYFWNETFVNSFIVAYILRYTLLLNITWLVNSAAHLYGTKPFDKFILPVESKFVAFVSIGEGWHNYHHTFPWDYRAAEFGSRYGVTTMVIDACFYLGLAYDLRTTPYEMIEKRTQRTGDGSRQLFGHERKKVEGEIQQSQENGSCDMKKRRSAKTDLDYEKVPALTTARG